MTRLQAEERPELRESARGGRLEVLLRSLVYATVADALAWPLTRPAAVAVAAFGAFAAVLLGTRVASVRLRLPLCVALGGLAMATVALVAEFIVDSPALGELLGPSNALMAGELIAFGGGALAIGAILRVASLRYRVLSIFEIAMVGLSAAQLVIAHRHGAINRPFEIADGILEAGGDPIWAFIAVGGVAVVILAFALVREPSAWRTLLHLAFVPLILLLLLWGVRTMGLPQPPPPDDALGLRGGRGQGDEEEEHGGGGGSSSNQDREDLEFRDDNSESQDRAPVGVVVFRGDYAPPSGVYYFRQGAFSQFNGRRLVAAVGRGVDEDIAPSFPAAPMELSDAPALNANRQSLETLVALLADHHRPFALEAPYRLSPEPNPNPSRFRRVYAVESAVIVASDAELFGASVGDPLWESSTWEHYTSSPDDPRYAELAERIVREELPLEWQKNDVARLFAITSWLGREGTYSLRSSHAEAEDPTADFLFGDRTGYCVHFAHAATFLMRSVGLPARVGTGYAIDESARQGGSALLVSGQNSHAWPEVYLDGVGWVVSDVSPANSLDPPPPPPDADLQRLLGELARGRNPMAPDAATDFAAMGEWVDAALAVAGRLLLLLLGLLVAGAAAIKSWRRLAPLFLAEEKLPRVAYRAALDRLSDLALRRARGETREAFARRLEVTCPSFEALTRVHVASAFGSGRVVATRDLVLPDIRSLDLELRSARPVWRRVLGALNPFSWLLSR